MARRSYTRHGLHALKARVMVRGLAAIDQRTAAAQLLLDWRRELLDDLGGEAAVSAAQLALVEVATRTRLYLDHVDAVLLERESLVVRGRRLLPLVEQRGRLASSLLEVLSKLGLERRQRPAPSLEDYIAKTYGRNGRERPHELHRRPSMTTDTKIPALAELEQRRQALAFEVEQGRDGAAQELEAVEEQIAQLTRHQERQALAERERAVRAEAEAQEAAEAERRQAQERLGHVLTEAGTAALELEAALIKLEVSIRAISDLGRQAYALSNQLGRPRAKLRLVEQLSGYLSWRLAEVLPGQFPRPDRAFRQPLTHMIAGLRGNGAAASPEPDAED